MSGGGEEREGLNVSVCGIGLAMDIRKVRHGCLYVGKYLFGGESASRRLC